MSNVTDFDELQAYHCTTISYRLQTFMCVASSKLATP